MSGTCLYVFLDPYFLSLSGNFPCNPGEQYFLCLPEKQSFKALYINLTPNAEICQFNPKKSEEIPIHHHASGADTFATPP
jgi:hypothetical protein